MRPSYVRHRAAMIFLRGLIWSLIGLIYAPLFLGLLAIFRDLGFCHAAFVPAAALASTAGAIFYGARQVGVAGTMIGLAITSVVLVSKPDVLGLWGTVCLAVVIGAVIGWWMKFPARCSLQVPAKAVAGLTTGALCGGIMAVAESLHPFDFRAASSLAFLVSVNGILYVSTVSWWVRRAVARGNRSCDHIEGAVVALMAGLAAGGLWIGAAPLIDISATNLGVAMMDLESDLPLAIFGAVFGGALAGILLEVFGFRWVHEG